MLRGYTVSPRPTSPGASLRHFESPRVDAIHPRGLPISTSNFLANADLFPSLMLIPHLVLTEADSRPAEDRWQTVFLSGYDVALET